MCPGIIKANYYLTISSIMKRKACLLEAAPAGCEAWQGRAGAKGTLRAWGGRPSLHGQAAPKQPVTVAKPWE